MIIWGSWWAWWISSPSPERCMEVAQNIELLLTQDSGGGGPGERVLQKYHLTFHRSVHSLKKNRSAKIKFAARHTGCLFNGSSPKMTKYWKVICPVGLVVATLTPQVLSPFTQLQNELILINQLFSSNLNPDLTGYKRNLCSSELPLRCLIGYVSALSKAPQKWLGYSIFAYFAESVENWRRWWCLWGWRWCNKQRGNDPSQCDTCSIGPRGDNSSIVVTRDTIHCLVYMEQNCYYVVYSCILYQTSPTHGIEYFGSFNTFN